MSKVKIVVLGGLFLTSLIVLEYNKSACAQSSNSPNNSPNQDNMLPEPEVLEQGPIHEAFAEPLSLGKTEAEIVAKRPPEPVQEIPPDEQPEGRNVEWIPGYFQYDRERDDFVWVSGLWRDVPPGRTWIPGEWQEVEGGWQWVPGFWSEGEEQLSLLPIPPDSLEAGPSSPAPGDDYLWAPGCWQWQGNGYAWQAGFWYQAQPNWVWVPNHYTYTNRGCFYVNGYWDYPLASRGWLYAPVYWGGGYGGFGRNYYYRPLSLINTGLLLANLFVDRGYGNYYYGYNWGRVPGWLQPWGANYGNWGYIGGRGRGNYRGYDPLWSYHRWNNRGKDFLDGDRFADDFDRGRPGDRANRGFATSKTGRDLITSVDDYKQVYKKSDGRQRGVRQLTDQEVASVKRQAEKYRNFDRSKIAIDASAKNKAQARPTNQRPSSRVDLDTKTTAQGRILRQGDENRGSRRVITDGDLSNRGQANAELRSRGRGNIQARTGAGPESNINRGQRSEVRSNTQVDGQARVQRGGKQLDSSQLRGNVNQRFQGLPNDGSGQTGRRELYYRGSPQQGSNQPQRWQQNLPNNRSQQGSLRQNVPNQSVIPQGNIRRGDSSSSPNIRSNSRSFQGGNQGVRQAVPQTRNFAPQGRGEFRGGGNSGGNKASRGGFQGGGGGGGRKGGGGKGRGK